MTNIWDLSTGNQSNQTFEPGNGNLVVSEVGVRANDTKVGTSLCWEQEKILRELQREGASCVRANGRSRYWRTLERSKQMKKKEVDELSGFFVRKPP